MTRRLIGSGSTFEEQIGYSRAVVDGEWVFVSGTTGFNYAAMSISDNLLEQTEQCFRNISAALDSAGATLRDVVRVLYILPNGAEFPQCWPVLRKYFGDIRPAATMISCGARRPAHEDRDPGDGRRTAAAAAPPERHLAAFEPGTVPSYDAGSSRLGLRGTVMVRTDSGLAATCHCGAVQIRVRRMVRTLTSCNCSICRRYGALWAYYAPHSVRIRAPKGGWRSTPGTAGSAITFAARAAAASRITPTAAGSARTTVGVNAANFEPGGARRACASAISTAPRAGSFSTDRRGDGQVQCFHKGVGT